MKINLLSDYLEENNINDYLLIMDESNGNKLYINGRLYNIYISLSADIPDDICNSIVINRRRYCFDICSIHPDKIHIMEG